MNEQELQQIALKLATDRFPLPAKIIIGVVIVALILGAAGVAYYFHQKHQEAVVLTEKQAADNKTLADKLHVSEQDAAKINAERAKDRPVVASYTVQAPTAEKAAAAVKKDNDAGVGPAGQIKADRTLIVPKENEYKVEVQKINLDKRWEAGVGAVVASGKVHPAATIQYNAGNAAYQVIGGQDVVGAFVKIRF